VAVHGAAAVVAHVDAEPGQRRGHLHLLMTSKRRRRAGEGVDIRIKDSTSM